MLTASVIWIAAGTSAAVSDAGPKSPQPSAAAGSGEPGTVRLTADQQHQIGLQTAVLEAAPHPEQFRAYGAVLDVARITDLTNSYANAQAQLQTAQLELNGGSYEAALARYTGLLEQYPTSEVVGERSEERL
jgi:hypothetical protein